MEIEKIILASGSLRPPQLLEWAEIPFDVNVGSTDESYPGHLSPAVVAVCLAYSKAISVKKNMTPVGMNSVYPILAADTIVTLENEIIGKPDGRDAAVATLAQLSGKTHEVITGVCILWAEQEIIFADKTLVEFYTLSQDQIAYYVDKYKPYDKAGAYAIQEWIGVTGIRSITGDFYNVMGLPVSRVLKELRTLG